MPGPDEQTVKIVCRSPDDQVAEPFRLRSGQMVHIGRRPRGLPGRRIVLVGATDQVSRNAAQVTFSDNQVTVRHLPSASPGVETAPFSCTPDGGRAHVLSAGQTYTFAGPGEFRIPDAEGNHVLRLEFDVPATVARPGPSSGGSTNGTVDDPNREEWKELCRGSDLRRQACTALVAAYFIDDFERIKHRTLPNNKQIDLLMGRRRGGAKLLSDTRRILDPRQRDYMNLGQDRIDRGRRIDRPMRGDSGGTEDWVRLQLANWILDYGLVRLEDVEALPGLVNPTGGELARTGH